MQRIKSIRFLVIFMLFILSSHCVAQDTTKIARFKPLVISSTVAYAGALIALNELWYSDFERQSFQFFNDNKEWKQLDKLGHFFSSFHLSHLGYKGLKWSGIEENKSIFWGTMVSVMVLTPIEVFDGFSAEYGASAGDLVANSAGALLFYSQQKRWGEIRIHPKYSFQRSGYAPLRPEILGANLSEELVKDYNAHTHWLSFDISKFNESFPRWINIAVGYAAKEMIYANDAQNKEIGLRPTRRYFISIDFDLNEYKGRSKIVNTLIDLVNVIKLPAPTIELSNSKFRFHSFYY